MHSAFAARTRLDAWNCCSLQVLKDETSLVTARVQHFGSSKCQLRVPIRCATASGGTISGNLAPQYCQHALQLLGRRVFQYLLATTVPRRRDACELRTRNATPLRFGSCLTLTLPYALFTLRRARGLLRAGLSPSLRPAAFASTTTRARRYRHVSRLGPAPHLT